MRKLRAKRVIVALITLLSALFTQLAIAGYMCPEKQLVQATDAVTALDASAGGQDMPNCDRPDAEQPSLCKAKSQGTEPGLDRIAASTAAPALATLSVAIVLPAGAPASSLVTHPTLPSLARPSEPPVSIRHCCFRI